MKYPFHPLANLFPLASAARLDEMSASIREHGQLLPIFLYEGQVLDGRNRMLACAKAGVEPIVADYTGTTPVQFLAALNFDRRDLKIGRASCRERV